MSPVEFTAERLKRLLDPADPALRVRVLTDLLERPANDPDVTDAREKIPEQPWVKATLKGYNGDGTWGRGFYHKYDGTSWSLLHLSEVGAPMDLPPIREGVKRLIETARPVQKMTGMRAEPFKDCRDGVYWELPVACLTAHMALVLIRAGHANHDVTRSALNACRHRFEKGAGFGCFIIDMSLVPSCIMTVPKVLKAFLALPPEYRTKKDQTFIKDMVAVLKKVELYKYVPRDAKEWRRWRRGKTPRKMKEEKPRWIEAGRLQPLREKETWLTFSFPHSYNSDLLEVLLLLGEAGARRDQSIDEALEIVRGKRGRDGMWKMEGGLNGRMHGRLDRTGRPSPWITYRALLAFKQFGLLILPGV